MNVYNILHQLNAWDRRHVEEPDYTQRLDGFQEARTLMKQSCPIEGLLMFLYNSTYIIANVSLVFTYMTQITKNQFQIYAAKYLLDRVPGRGV